MTQVVATGARTASAEAIQLHYDVSNEFFRTWLDRECIYSCALWVDGAKDLEQAQINKLDYVLKQSEVQPGERLLDIGCGWGGTLRRAKDVYGVSDAIGVTLSKAQVQYITSPAQTRPGLSAAVQGWQEHVPTQPYHAIVSMGAFEHFARPELDEPGKISAYRAFFERCHAWLAPERRLVLQTIIYEDASSEDINPFVLKEIFPESELPHLHEITKASKGLFEVLAMRGDREHYVRTLEAWIERLRANRAQATELVGAEGVERYDRYLKLSRLGFLAGNLGLARITFRKLRDFGVARLGAKRPREPRKGD
jgi:cyclopropane-fatty-acyl-phospholipid synthase